MTTSLSRSTRLSLLSVAVAGVFAPAVSAQTTIVLEDPVVVTATRVAEPLSEAAASISVITAKTIEENVPQTFAETLLDVPNVDVTSSESVMFNRVSIRGSDANQITYLIDGMRQEDTTIGGNQPVGLFIDPEMVKQVEVRRGGGSSLYGNGGIGGTVAVTTKDAADFLAGTDKDWGVKVNRLCVRYGKLAEERLRLRPSRHLGRRGGRQPPGCRGDKELNRQALGEQPRL